MQSTLNKTAVLVAGALALAACGKGDSARPASGGKPGAAPVASAGLTVTALATGLRHPRAVYPLPNGDILIVEATGPAAPVLRPRDLFKERDSTAGVSGRITLVRPATDGGAARQTVLLDHLAAPGGVVLVGTDLYVANTDALVRYPYNTGDTHITAAGTKVIALPAGPINRRWARTVVASEDGRKLYVGVGASSNVGENGMAAEQGRAAIVEVDRATGAVRTFASGLHDPGAIEWEPHSHALWVAVKERDNAPGYLTAVRQGGFYGWPYSGPDTRPDPLIMPQRPDLVAQTIAPDYPLAAQGVPSGMAFNNPASTMPPPLRDGVFVALQAGAHKVAFVPFFDGKPSGRPVDVVTGFSPGRPAGLVMDHRGALLIADDVANTVWRVSGPPLK